MVSPLGLLDPLGDPTHCAGYDTLLQCKSRNQPQTIEGAGAAQTDAHLDAITGVHWMTAAVGLVGIGNHLPVIVVRADHVGTQRIEVS
jgi:hypothetical protein